MVISKQGMSILGEGSKSYVPISTQQWCPWVVCWGRLVYVNTYIIHWLYYLYWCYVFVVYRPKFRNHTASVGFTISTVNKILYLCRIYKKQILEEEKQMHHFKSVLTLLMFSVPTLGCRWHCLSPYTSITIGAILRALMLFATYQTHIKDVYVCLNTYVEGILNLKKKLISQKE